MKIVNFFWIATITACLVLPCVGRNAAAHKPTLGPSAAVLASWNEIGRKLIAMAEDFPGGQVRLQANACAAALPEQLLHMAGSNDFVTDVANGKKPRDDGSREHFKTKIDVGFLGQIFHPEQCFARSFRT